MPSSDDDVVLLDGPAGSSRSAERVWAEAQERGVGLGPHRLALYRGLPCRVRFAGFLSFARRPELPYAGVELFEPLGKNDGAVRGRLYFSERVEPLHGLFVPMSDMAPYPFDADCLMVSAVRFSTPAQPAKWTPAFAVLQPLAVLLLPLRRLGRDTSPLLTVSIGPETSVLRYGVAADGSEIDADGGALNGGDSMFAASAPAALPPPPPPPPPPPSAAVAVAYDLRIRDGIGGTGKLVCTLRFSSAQQDAANAGAAVLADSVRQGMDVIDLTSAGDGERDAFGDVFASGSSTEPGGVEPPPLSSPPAVPDVARRDTLATGSPARAASRARPVSIALTSADMLAPAAGAPPPRMTARHASRVWEAGVAVACGGTEVARNRASQSGLSPVTPYSPVLAARDSPSGARRALP